MSTEVDVKSYVDSRFTATTGYANAALATLNTFLTNLSTQITSFTGTPISFTGIAFPADIAPAAITAAPSTLDTALLARLNSAVANSKILSAAEEQALYDRALGRTDTANAKLEYDAANFCATRGFELPDGVMLATIQGAANEQARNSLEINSEVLSKSGELAVRGASETLQAASSYALNYMNTLLTAARANSEALVGAADSNTRKAATRTELVIKEAEMRIREAGNVLQLQLDSLKAGAQVNAQIVASALSSFNSSISYGFAGGWNENSSIDLSKATVSESIIHNLSV